MIRFVLDNSVVMRWLFGDGSSIDMDYASHVLKKMKNTPCEIIVPGIWHFEVANVIARAESRKLIPEARSSAFLENLRHFSLFPDPETADHALDDTLNIARRFGLSAYDASYLELALRRDLPLATLDEELRKAMTASGCPLF